MTGTEILLIVTTTTLITLTLMLLILAMLRNMRGGETKSGAVLKHESLAAHYRPMLRLLDESDCGFMAAQLEGKASLRRLRAERRSLFRLYLRELRADHARIVRAIRELLVQSEIDRPDLCQALHRCQFLFALAMASINYKL